MEIIVVLLAQELLFFFVCWLVVFCLFSLVIVVFLYKGVLQQRACSEVFESIICPLSEAEERLIFESLHAVGKLWTILTGKWSISF